ncbi:MAG: AI-2E family transporter [Candidatus Cloacimonetes bacterium]|nr:AI-2E family transporter [Candidatus Cloacimonadota bacterium]
MQKSTFLRWILRLLGLLIIIAAFLFYRHIFAYLVVSFICAYLISPVINYAERYNIPRPVSILVVYVILAFLLVFIFNIIIPQLIQQGVDFARTIQRFLDNQESLSIHSLGWDKLSNFILSIESRFPKLAVDEQIKSFLSQDKINDLIAKIPNIFQSLVNLLAFLIVIPVVVFFILKDERNFTRSIFSSISNRYFEFSLYLWQEIEASFGRFFRALLLETLLVAVMSIIGLLILNIPNAIILGLIVGLANPIKYFGPFIGAVPTILVILLGPTPNVYVFYVAIMFFIVQQIDSLILFPWMVGKSMNMHPLIVLLTVIAGGYAYGILGMLFGVPIVFLIKTIIQVSLKSLKQFEII